MITLPTALADVVYGGNIQAVADLFTLRLPAVPAAPAGHRYWRYYITERHDSFAIYIGIHETEMRAVAGGPDITGSGTAIASSYYTEGTEAAKAVDNSTDTKWTAFYDPGVWWGMDFGTPVSVAEFTISNGADQPTRMPKAFQLQWSDDGSAWTTVRTYSDLVWTTSVETKTFAGDTSTGPTVLRWTNFDAPLSFGGETWTNPGVVLNTPVARSALGLEVATVRISLASATVTVGGLPVQQAAAARAFDGARVEIRRTYMDNPGTVPGTVLRFAGEVSDVEPGSMTVQLTIRSDMAKLDQVLPRRVTAPACPYAVYSAQCGAVIGDFTDTHTVTSGSTRKIVNLSGTSANANVDGWLEFTSGALAGKRATIGAVIDSNTVELYLSLPAAPAVGDGVNVVRGCSKRRLDCIAFGRLASYGGMPEMPAEEST